MRARSAFRLGFVAVAATVGLAVYTQWSPPGGQVAAGEEEPIETAAPRRVLETPESNRPSPVSAVTRSLSVTQVANDRERFTIKAEEQLDFTDGWQEWAAVELRISDAEGDGEPVVVRGDRMQTSGDVGAFEEIQISDNVHATLPGGVEFRTRRVDWDRATGVVSNCRRNTLWFAGLEVKSDCLELATSGQDEGADTQLVARQLRLWGDLVIRSAPAVAESSLPANLRGSAERLLMVPGGDTVLLEGDSRLDFLQGWLTGDQLTLELGAGGRSLRDVRASAGARLRWFPNAKAARVEEPSSEFADAASGVDGRSQDPTDDGEEEDRGGSHTLQGDNVRLSFDAAATVSSIEASSEASESASLAFAGRGKLTARTLQLVPDGDSQRVKAAGGAKWRGRDPDGALPSLEAARLTLVAGDEGIRSLEASGKIVAELIAEDGQKRRFRGESLELRWLEGRLVTGKWSESVSFTEGARLLTAGEADYDAATGGWILGGEPAPSVSDDDLDVQAPQISLAGSGEVSASGGVRAAIIPAQLGALQAIFGAGGSVGDEDDPDPMSVARVDLRAPSLELGAHSLRLDDGSQIVWGEQSLVSEALLLTGLDGGPQQLHATGDVELLVASGASGASSSDEASSEAPESQGWITLRADSLLVEGDPPELRVAGDAQFTDGDRRVESDRITVALGDAGGWNVIEAEGDVRFIEPNARAEAERLIYSPQLERLELFGSSRTPARLEYGGVEYTSVEALTVHWRDDSVEVAATENGRTVTNVVRRPDITSIQ